MAGVTTQQSDQELITACLAGDEIAWDTLIDRYSRLIYAIPLRFGLPPMLADEIFQEVCLTLLNKLDTLHSTTRLSAWITTVTRRRSIDYLRRQKPEVALDGLEFDDGSPKLEHELIEMEQATALQTAMERLDERCGTLLNALFLTPDPPSYDELADKLAIAKGSIGPTRNRCLKKLRNLVLEVES